MTDTEKLKAAIRASGLKLGAIMDATGIKAYATLRDRINGKSEFTAKEIFAISNILNLTPDERDAIFFAGGD